MKTTKTVPAMTFAAALCCASPVFAGGHMGTTGGMAGNAGVRSSRTMDGSFRQSNLGGNHSITASPQTGTHINANGNASSKLFSPLRFLNRFGSGHTVKGQHGQSLHPQAQHQRSRERSLDNGKVTEQERERQRELPSGAIQQQRQEQLTNAAGQTQTRSQERTIQPSANAPTKGTSR